MVFQKRMSNVFPQEHTFLAEEAEARKAGA